MRDALRGSAIAAVILYDECRVHSVKEYGTWPEVLGEYRRLRDLGLTASIRCYDKECQRMGMCCCDRK